MTRNRKIANERILAQSIGGAYDTVNDYWLVLKVWLSLFGEFGEVLCADHVRYGSYHPFIKRR